MSKFSFSLEHIPSFEEYSMGIRELKALLKDTFPVLKSENTNLFDLKYYYISHEDWGKVFDDVLTGMPRWTTDKFDCENFAILASARVSLKYRLNTCGIATGHSPWNGHGFNVFLTRIDDKPELYILEPQNGMVYKFGESEYSPLYLIFG